MNEVEKMYKNVGINVISQKTKDCNYCYYYEETYDAPCHVCTADKCPFEKNIISPFTAEKQMFLLHWLLDKTDIYLHRHKTDFTYSIASGDIAVNKYKDLKESIAEFINAIWQDLTEEERKQIKEILE